ncbi:Glycosyltransferase involved in cell wall bisynthesis [Pseudobutyrivibrio sp. UC1225]|uniref:glycosyltransferase family 2 protein n=1 Tax=Pseudobutyrivibrio sp. UC1225 TaxID=1798185 RepID=UPI0008E71F23|nr:glycosyltransferase family 2 protein [Pseudobutyrivibrio sp. UC1225]SFN78625.1 Glycosyltransferase involved in cell wall bisynthesis [Pseudobutyrivibrio sp. UC1225]
MSKISVIVPVYNVENYLDRCIESIVNQSYRNLEIILVNDGSTDKSGEICNRLARVDNRIRVIHKENGGLSSARNAGLDSATGDYIAFIDSDDYIHTKMYEILVKVQKDTGADIVSCGYQMFDEGDVPKEIDYDNFEFFEYTGTDIYNQLWDRDTSTVIQCQKLFNKDVFSHIRYPEGRIHEDVYVIHRELGKVNKYVFVDIPFYYYMIRNGSIMQTESFTSINDALEGFEDRIRFFSTRGLHEYEDRTLKTLFEYIQLKYRMLAKDNNRDGCRYLQSKMNMLLAMYNTGDFLENKELSKYRKMRKNYLILNVKIKIKSIIGK